MTAHHPIESDHGRRRRLLLRVGGACAIAGTLVLAAALAVHGDLPADQSAAVALRFIADHPNWFVIHLGMIGAALLWVGAFVSLSAAPAAGAAAVLGRLLAPFAAIGGAFSIFNYAIDGYAFGLLAQRWEAAPDPAARAEIERILDTILAFSFGTYQIEIIVFYGLTFLLAGLVVATGRHGPAWFGAIASVAGAAVVIAGGASLAGFNLTPDWLTFAVILPLEGLWLLALGVLMWQRAPRADYPAEV